MLRTVLISGAGIAGTTLAWWLARNGFAPTVVERARRDRSSGAPVDVLGQAFEIVAGMGVINQLRQAATHVREMVFIDGRGREAARVDMTAFFDDGEHIELPRGDLARLLYEASNGDAEYVFNDQILECADTPSGVEVRFESGLERRFDLLIGADGLHSRVRKLAFGPEDTFVHYAGLYFATMPLPDERPDPSKVLLYNRPGRAIAIHPARDKALCAFIFRYPQVPDFNPRDGTQHTAILEAAYRNQGWLSNNLLEKTRMVDDLYFDAVSTVSLDKWSRGRVALVGDAASCLSLFGNGSSNAIIGAQILAKELGATRDHSAAFIRYEQLHRPLVESRLRNFRRSAVQVVPNTAAGIALRNLVIRLMPFAGLFTRMLRKG
jgi:2-polyprenyl-6-methoxyphenol hydroxylase-like FAD-dependent oxidoreductase